MFEKCFIECPCAFFGHSMGGVIAFELSHAVRSRINSANPVHLFVSGRYPPHLKGSGVIMHKLTDAEFKAEILKLGGVPKEVFENQDMMDIFLPILKADYKIVETYSYAKKENRLECGITVLNGEQDIAVPTDVMVRWREYTCREFNLYNLAGGHFFIHNNIERITEIINGALTGRM
jgi:surfactin synthase thioesterase subunit